MWAAKSQGIRMYRSDKLDELATPEPEFRDDRLRELVDRLPKRHRRVIEGMFFGSLTINEVALDLGVSGLVAKRLRDEALVILKRKVA